MISACQSEKSADTAEAVSLDQPAIISANEGILFMFPELPSIQMNEPGVLVPDASKGIFDSILTFMQANPDQVLVITGYYSPAEEGAEGYENLGMARADHLAGMLKDAGVEGNKITMHSVMEDLVFDDAGMLQDGYRLAFKKIEMKAAGAYDRTVLFWAAEKLMTFDPELKDYIPAVRKYMEENPGVKMVLTGHTDENGNHLLGKMRAEALADYFSLYGIDTSRVVIRSEGPDKPVAPNDTQENKGKNRRVEIVFE